MKTAIGVRILAVASSSHLQQNDVIFGQVLQDRLYYLELLAIGFIAGGALDCVTVCE